MTVDFLPLGLMAAVFRISLIAMATIASRLIEKEKLTMFRIIAVVLGVIGIVLMTQPEFIFGERHPDVVSAGEGTSSVQWVNMTSPPDMYPEYSNPTSPPENLIMTITTDFQNVTPPQVTTAPNFSTTDAISSTSPGTTIGFLTQTNAIPASSPHFLANLSNRSSLNNSEVPTASPQMKSATKSRSIIPTEGLSNRVLMTIGICLTLVAAFLVVMQGVCMKRKVLADYCVWKISFWVGVVGLVCTMILSVSLEDMVFIATAKDLSLVLTYSIFASLHLFTFLFAINKASYLIVAVIMVTQIAFNLLAQYTVLSSIFPGKHNLLEILGGVTVLVAAALPSVKEALTKYFVKANKIHFLARNTVRLASLPITKESERKDPSGVSFFNF